MITLLRLIFAHIISDFVFQCDKICAGKQGKTKKKYVYQLVHGSIHALMAYLFVADRNNWIIPLTIFISHILMDYIKVEYMKKKCRIVHHRPTCSYSRYSCLMVIFI